MILIVFRVFIIVNMSSGKIKTSICVCIQSQKCPRPLMLHCCWLPLLQILTDLYRHALGSNGSLLSSVLLSPYICIL